MSEVWHVVKESVHIFEEAMREEAWRALGITAEAIRAEAEASAPHAHENRIGKSLAIVPDEEHLAVEIGTSGKWAFLGRMHEHGTVKMGAHPFLGPAAEHNTGPNAAQVEQAVAKAIERA